MLCHAAVAGHGFCVNLKTQRFNPLMAVLSPLNREAQL